MDSPITQLPFSPTEINGLAAIAWTWTAAFAPRLLAALVILVLGFLAAAWSRRALDGLTRRSRWVDDTVRSFLVGVVQYSLVILVLILVLNQVGIQTSSLLAVLGAAGLAVGLALQGTLSNIAAGLMLLWLRPFRVGDYIEVGGLAGTVEETGLFACTLRSFDGIRVFAPNSTIWNVALRNHSQVAARMIALSVTLAAEVPEAAARAILMGMLEGDERVAKQPAPAIFLEGLGGGATTLMLRFWATRGSYGDLQRSIADLARQKLHDGQVAPDAIQGIARTVPLPADPTRFMQL